MEESARALTCAASTGLLMKLSPGDIEKLYSWPSVRAFGPNRYCV